MAAGVQGTPGSCDSKLASVLAGVSDLDLVTGETLDMFQRLGALLGPHDHWCSWPSPGLISWAWLLSICEVIGGWLCGLAWGFFAPERANAGSLHSGCTPPLCSTTQDTQYPGTTVIP